MLSETEQEKKHFYLISWDVCVLNKNVLIVVPCSMTPTVQNHC